MDHGKIAGKNQGPKLRAKKFISSVAIPNPLRLPLPDPDPLRFPFPDPDPLKKALILIRVAPKLFKSKK